MATRLIALMFLSGWTTHVLAAPKSCAGYFGASNFLISSGGKTFSVEAKSVESVELLPGYSIQKVVDIDNRVHFFDPAESPVDPSALPVEAKKTLIVLNEEKIRKAICADFDLYKNLSSFKKVKAWYDRSLRRRETTRWGGTLLRLFAKCSAIPGSAFIATVALWRASKEAQKESDDPGNWLYTRTSNFYMTPVAIMGLKDCFLRMKTYDRGKFWALVATAGLSQQLIDEFVFKDDPATGLHDLDWGDAGIGMAGSLVYGLAVSAYENSPRYKRKFFCH